MIIVIFMSNTIIIGANCIIIDGAMMFMVTVIMVWRASRETAPFVRPSAPTFLVSSHTNVDATFLDRACGLLPASQSKLDDSVLNFVRALAGAEGWT